MSESVIRYVEGTGYLLESRAFNAELKRERKKVAQLFSPPPPSRRPVPGRYSLISFYLMMDRAKNLDEAMEQFSETMDKIYSLLIESGLPDLSIDGLRGMIEKEEHLDALSMVEEYSKAFPYMDTASLVFLLADAWEQLCTMNDFSLSKSRKKIVLLVADSKTEPEVMEAAEGKRDECEKLCTRGNLKLYKMRALKKVWEAKSGGGEEEGGAEEETN